MVVDRKMWECKKYIYPLRKLEYSLALSLTKIISKYYQGIHFQDLLKYESTLNDLTFYRYKIAFANRVRYNDDHPKLLNVQDKFIKVLVNLLSKVGVDVFLEVQTETGSIEDLVILIFKDIITDSVRDDVLELILDEIKLDTSSDKSFMEYSVSVISGNLVILEKGDYRINRYYELIENGTIKK